MEGVSSSIQAGYHTIIKVQAMEIVPSQDLYSVPKEERKCRFENEHENLELFSLYSQSACEFEYKIKMAEENCRCTPWYYPSKMDKQNYNLCDLYGNYCFKTAMNQIEEVPEEICLPSCHQLQFTSTRELIKSNAEELCKTDLSSEESYLAKLLLENGYSKQYYEYLKLKEDDDYKLDTSNIIVPELIIQNICQALVDQDIAMVSVMFERKRFVRTKTNIRVTFLDMLSAFGNLLKLFSHHISK